MTQLLSGFGRWLELRGTLRIYGPAISWGAFLLVVHVQTWWAMFGLREWEDWNFLQFIFVLLQPILLFLLAVLAFPGAGSPQRDLRTNFFAQRKWFFALHIALLCVSINKDLVRSGELPEAPNLAFHAIMFITSIIGLKTERDIHHSVLGYSALIGISVYIVALFARLT